MMEFKNDTTEHSLNYGMNEKIKEELCLNDVSTDVQHSEFFSVEKDEKFCATKMEIKLESLPVHEPPNEVKFELKQAPISKQVSCMGFDVMKSDIKEEPLRLNELSNNTESGQTQHLIWDSVPWTVEDLQLKEKSMESESICSGNSKAASCFFTHVDSEKNSLASNDKQASVTDVKGKLCNTYTCEICCELKEHTASHTGKSVFKSDTYEGNLKHHILTVHENKRPHSCDICGVNFAHVTHLKNHKLRHEGKRPHACVTCNKSFTTKSQLRRHESMHIDDRPYSCDICNKAFTVPYKLKRHRSTHDGKILKHLLK